MGAGITFYDNRIGQPNWYKGELGPTNMARFPAKVDASQFVDDSGVKVKLTANAAPGTNERQTITIDATGGVWTIVPTGSGLTPVSLSDAVSTADLQTALDSLVGAGNIRVVSGTPSTSYLLEFIGIYAGQNISNTFFTLVSTGLTGGGATASIAETVAGAAGATALTVTALDESIPGNVNIYFGPGQVVRVSSAGAAKGATSVPIEQLSGYVMSGDVGYYSTANRKTILSGRLCGRTYAERDASTPFGKANVALDDEIYLLLFTIPDALQENDAEFLKHDREVVLERLPGYADFTAAELTWLRAHYICITAAGG